VPIDVENLIALLDLRPHPEGGFYREVHRSEQRLELERGARAACTAIHYVLPAGAFSALHRVTSDEVWSWFDGDPLDLHLLHPDGRYERTSLGRDAAAGEVPLAVVPAGAWQGAGPATAGGAWCGCTVAPGFEFADFELGGRDQLLQAFPDQRELVRRLTH
jgi:predicted cupin superfamily sugar epimerase